MTPEGTSEELSLTPMQDRPLALKKRKILAIQTEAKPPDYLEST
jgi:hypothetical protein